MKPSPFLLQGGEVLLKGWADLTQQFHQRVAQEAGVGRLRVEIVGGGPKQKTLIIGHTKMAIGGINIGQG